MVEKNTCPPGRTSLAHAATMLAGWGTCSSNSMQVTASNCPACAAAKSSTTAFSYRTGSRLSSKCSCATFSALSERSMPVTRAPRCAIASAKIPPPQPTSSTFFPRRPRCASIHPRRSGLISCNGLNSPCGSHQRCASWLNLASSAGSAFMQRFSQIKSPARAGLVGHGGGLLLPRADDLDLDAAIRRQARHQLLVAAVLGSQLLALVAGHGLFLALAFGVDAAWLDALPHQVALDRFGAGHRQLLD